MRARHGLTVLAILLAAGAAAAHVRLHHPIKKTSLYWPKPGNIKVSIDPAGSDDITDSSETTAMRLGMRVWNEDPGSKAQLVETSFTGNDPCNDWLELSSHLVFFDEIGCSGFFGGSGAVAVTPVLFNNEGKILDADVIFNGQDYDFTTSGAGGAFDVQDVGTHELGHLLGLDHSGWAGATMYPYVDTGLVLQRSLSLDDVHGLRHIAPQGPQGRINGQVVRLSDNSGVAGAHVHAVDASGRSAGAALADSNGNYSLRGLDAGDYTVHAEPLDGPVVEGNLQSGHTIETDFEATAGPMVSIGTGQTMTAPDFSVDADVVLSLGTGFDALPLECETGSVVAHTLNGVGLAPGTSLSASDPGIGISAVVGSGNAIDFLVSTPGGTTPGHVDLIAQNGGSRSVLVAAIEIVPPAPTVTNVTPATGNDIGGTAVTITGTGFRPGARVIIGEDIYEDGAAGGCTVVGPTTITLSSQASPTGTFDVVVMDETGVEGRDTAAFTINVMPVLATRFPEAGDSAGGTELILTGGNFQPGMTVRIDSAVQSNVVLEGTTVARVTTDAGAPGAPDAGGRAPRWSDGHQRVRVRGPARPDPPRRDARLGRSGRGQADHALGLRLHGQHDRRVRRRSADRPRRHACGGGDVPRRQHARGHDTRHAGGSRGGARHRSDGPGQRAARRLLLRVLGRRRRWLLHGAGRRPDRPRRLARRAGLARLARARHGGHPRLRPPDPPPRAPALGADPGAALVRPRCPR